LPASAVSALAAWAVAKAGVSATHGVDADAAMVVAAVADGWASS
jgi:hypothetical protein